MTNHDDTTPTDITTPTETASNPDPDPDPDPETTTHDDPLSADDIGWNTISGVGRCVQCYEPLRFVPCTNCQFPNSDVETEDEEDDD